MQHNNRLGWIDCTDGNDATALIQAVGLPWEIHKWDPQNALQALSERQPDAIVFDFSSTSRTNLRLVLTIKRQYPAIPILMVTEEHSEILAIWAFRARVWNYLVKPVSIREFNRNLMQLAKIVGTRDSSSRTIERPSSTFPGQSVAGGDSQGVVDLIAETMRRDYARELRAGDLAQSLKMSRFQFCRLFKRSFGCSFRTYLTRLRIGSACRLLSKSGGAASVTEVGLAVGFQDASYFARMFRQATGESPSTYARTALKPTVRETSVFQEADDTDEYVSGQTELVAATGSDY
jgi:YesN/AraC family two-component response regulator